MPTTCQRLFLLFLLHLKQLLNTQLPLPARKSILAETFFLTAYTLFVLFLFQPFGTHEYAHPYKLTQLCGYGLLVLVFYPAMRRGLLLLPADSYSFKKEALLLFMCFMLLIVLGFFYHAAVIMGYVYWSGFLPFILNGLVFLVLPFFALLYRATTTAKKETHKPPDEKIISRDTLEIKGTNLYEHFYFNTADVLYLKSNGNYVMIYFQKDGAVKHEMIRNTLNQVSGQLTAAGFTSIHRSFLVNLKKFDKLLREDGKHLLVNRQFDIRLPVSKNHVPAIEQKLKDHS